jgi:dolichyl-phosphate-mannose--protein O-mannosyl transferase
VILVGFVTQYLPWARITRVVFLYHMFGGLIFMILALAFVLVRMQQAGPFHVSDRAGVRFALSTRWLVPAFLALAVLAFLYLYPVWTGLPISDGAYLGDFSHGGKMWVGTWI